MKRKYVFVISCMTLICLIMGCSADKVHFDDKDLSFKMIHTQSNHDISSYAIEIRNNSKAELTHLSLYLSYPIKQANGSRSNPFAIEGKTNQARPVNLNPGESVVFTIVAPITEVFTEINVLDIDHLDIDLMGFVIDGRKEIPFQMSGGLAVFIRN